MEADESSAPKRQARPRSIVFCILLAAALYAMIQAYALLAPILLSFILILLITLAVNPLISRLRIMKGGRKQATGLALMGVFSLGALIIWASADPLAKAVTNLSDQLPSYWERIQKPLIKMEQKGVLTEEKLQVQVRAEIALETPEPEPVPGEALSAPPIAKPTPQADVSQQPDKAEKSLRSGFTDVILDMFGQFKGVALSTTQMLIVLFTVFFGVTFTLMNPRPVFGALFAMVPERHHAQTLTIMIRIAKFLPRWAGAMLISMLTIGSLFFVLMWPIFGFADAILLGLIACLFSAIPFLGPLLTLIPALLLAIGEGGMTPVWVVLAYLAIQALEGNVILPLIMSRGMKLHPVAVIFSMLVSVAAFGVLGVLIAVPLVAIVSIVHEELYRKRFLPTVTDEDLDHLARGVLHERKYRKVRGYNIFRTIPS
jgi:predicted PurR-regulated permease PerM